VISLIKNEIKGCLGCNACRYGKPCVLRGRACFDPALGLVQREEHAFLRK